MNGSVEPDGRKDEWTAILADWDASGESGAAYCRTRGLVYWCFVYWKKRLRGVSGKRPDGDFVSLNMGHESSNSCGLSVLIGTEVRLELGSGFDESELVRAVRALRESIC